MPPSHTHFPLLLLYMSTDNPPGIPAFTGSQGHRTSQVAALTSAVTQMAQVMTPPSHSHSTTELSGNTSTAASISPAKLANLRSNYLQQMRDLHSLFECGAISESEFREQKAPILEQLKKLVPG